MPSILTLGLIVALCVTGCCAPPPYYQMQPGVAPGMMFPANPGPAGTFGETTPSAPRPKRSAEDDRKVPNPSNEPDEANFDNTGIRNDRSMEDQVALEETKLASADVVSKRDQFIAEAEDEDVEFVGGDSSKVSTRAYEDPANFEDPIETTSSESDLKEESLFAHDEKFRWVRGVVVYEETTGQWTIIYDSKPDQNDEYGGTFELVNNSEVSGLTPSSVVTVIGSIDSNETDDFGKPRFRATRVETARNN